MKGKSIADIVITGFAGVHSHRLALLSGYRY
jgi:hypothetical protein